MKYKEMKELEGKSCGWGGETWRIEKIDEAVALIINSRSCLVVPTGQLMMPL